jgi:hypothetical protein
LRFVGRVARQIRLLVNPEGPKRDHTGRKVTDATLPRKASKEGSRYPYRKPTQVGEEKILRRK